jgi:chromosome partitioning protein
MQKTPIIISLSNNKGGIGKTNTTKNLANALALQNHKVAVVDMDDQSNLKMQHKDSWKFDLINTDKSLAQLQKLKTLDYEYVLIDCPPDLGTETVYSYLVSNYVLIPTQLANHSLLGMAKTLEAIQKPEIKQRNPNLQLLGVLVTFFDRRDREADKLLETLQNKLNEHLMTSIIRISSSIKQSDDMNQLVQEYESSWYRDKKSTNDFTALAKEIISKTKK